MNCPIFLNARRHCFLRAGMGCPPLPGVKGGPTRVNQNLTLGGIDSRVGMEYRASRGMRAGWERRSFFWAIGGIGCTGLAYALKGTPCESWQRQCPCEKPLLWGSGRGPSLRLASLRSASNRWARCRSAPPRSRTGRPLAIRPASFKNCTTRPLRWSSNLGSTVSVRARAMELNLSPGCASYNEGWS